MLPNLIVIGAPKCGTTSLHHYLDLHPQVAMARAKELDFFIDTRNWEMGIAWYESQFRAAPVRGESSPAYTRYPQVPGVPERMAQIVPDARLVYLVRDPIDRVISSYRFRRWILGEQGREINEALADVEHSASVAASRYALQLEQYLAHFPKQQIMVVDSTDLRASTGPTLARIFSFIGVDDTFASDEFSRRVGETDGLQANALGRAMRSFAFRTVGQYRARAFKSRVPQPLQRFLLSPLDVPQVTLDPGVRKELEAFFKPDVDRLRALTGQRFESWSV